MCVSDIDFNSVSATFRVICSKLPAIRLAEKGQNRIYIISLYIHDIRSLTWPVIGFRQIPPHRDIRHKGTYNIEFFGLTLCSHIETFISLHISKPHFRLYVLKIFMKIVSHSHLIRNKRRFTETNVCWGAVTFELNRIGGIIVTVLFSIVG
jgi:hypothetical protein